MKTLENQTLLYDKDCPLCQAYTTGFIKAGMLDKNGKKPFSNLTNEEQNFIDNKTFQFYIATLLFFCLWYFNVNIYYSNFLSVCLFSISFIHAIYLSVLIYKKEKL